MKHFPFLHANTENFLLIVGLCLHIVFWAKPNRDKSKIKDVQIISQVVEPRTSLGIPTSLRADWSLRGYCQRIAKISLDEKKAGERRWYLANNNDPDLGNDYELIPLGLKSYKLYKKIN